MYKIGTIKATELSRKLAYETIEWMNANNQNYHNPPVNHMCFDDEVYSYNKEKKEIEFNNHSFPTFHLKEKSRVGDKIILSPNHSLEIDYCDKTARDNAYEWLFIYFTERGEMNLCGKSVVGKKPRIVPDLKVDLSAVKLPKRRKSTPNLSFENKTDFATRKNIDYSKHGNFQVYGLRVDYDGKTHYYAGLTEVKKGKTPDEAMVLRFKRHLQKNSPIAFIISQVGIDQAYLTPIEPLIVNKTRGEAEAIETAHIHRIQKYCKGKKDSIRVNLHDNTQNFITLDPNDEDSKYIQNLCVAPSGTKTHKSGFKRTTLNATHVSNEKRNWAEMGRILTRHFALKHTYPIIIADVALVVAAGYPPTRKLNIGQVTHWRRKLGI